jgi:ubiquinone/menaquinone biosynthesis C-methylase UbiE
MKSSKNHKTKQETWESQYTTGETLGPWWYQKLVPWVKNREEVAFDYLKSQANLNQKNILDIGCGEGDFVLSIAPLVKQAVGSDIARNRLKIATQRAKSFQNVTFEYIDNDQKTKFKDNSFDIITLLGVLEYTFDPYQTLADIHRMLKPGGIFIIEVPNLAYLPERLKLLFGFLPSWPDAEGWQGGRLHNFTMASTVKLVTKSGFSVQHQTGSGFMKKFRDWWPSLLCGDVIVAARKSS